MCIRDRSKTVQNEIVASMLETCRQESKNQINETEFLASVMTLQFLFFQISIKWLSQLDISMMETGETV